MCIIEFYLEQIQGKLLTHYCFHRSIGLIIDFRSLTRGIPFLADVICNDMNLKYGP